MDNTLRKMMREIFEDCTDFERGRRYQTNAHSTTFLSEIPTQPTGARKSRAHIPKPVSNLNRSRMSEINVYKSH
jgi:hypothetical protein